MHCGDEKNHLYVLTEIVKRETLLQLVGSRISSHALINLIEYTRVSSLVTRSIRGYKLSGGFAWDLRDFGIVGKF